MNGGDASVEEFCAQLNSIKVDYERTSAEHENATKKKQYLQNDVESIKLRIQQLIPEVQELSLQFATLSQDEEEWNWKISMQEKEIQAQNELTNSLNEELQSLQNTFITQRNVAMEEIRSFKQEHEMLKQKKKTMMAQEGPLRADIEQTERLISNAQLERSQTEHELHVSQQECKKEELKKQQVLATYKELLEKQEQTRTIMEQEHEVLAQLRAQDQE
jgi:chromosome segregation ATPase